MAKVRFTVFLLMPLMLLSGTARACEKAAGLEALSCHDSESGWFYAADEARAATLAADAEIAGDLFERYFDHPAPRGAVVTVGSGGKVPGAQIAALREIGAKWVLPWLTAEEKLMLRERTVRRAIATQLGAKEDDARVEALVQKALGQIATKPADGSTDSGTDRSALRHEIGHMLLINGFWPEQTTTSGDSPHYGGPAPDWLDEAAAVLMEDDAMTADRRRALLELRDSNGDGPSLQPLAEYFVMEHPLKALAAAQFGGGSRSGGATVHIVSGAEAQKLGAQAAWFYAQARGVADFLIAASGNEKIFGSIAQAAAAGESTTQWLSREGARNGLPPTMAELESKWQAWLQGL